MSKSEERQEWTMEIKPRRGLLEIDLKELWRYRDLILLFVRRDFVAKYKQTILGPLWFLIQPLITTIMFTIVFGKIAKIPTDGLPQMLFYMTGIVAWNYFAECLKTTSNTFVANAQLFGKVYFPRLALPISVVLSNLFTFIIQFLFLLLFMVYFYVRGANLQPNTTLLLLPFLVLLLALLGLGFGIIVSSLTTKYRDLTHLVVFGVQLWMYATPIAYPLSEIPEKYNIYLVANPLTSIIETFRYALLGNGSFNSLHLLYTTICTICVLTIGILLFNRIEKTFMDTV